MTIADVKQEEYSLPEELESSSCDMADAEDERGGVRPA